MSDSAPPLVLAHRGYHALWAENSLAALCAAEAVADGFETDVRLSADGALVLAHDPFAPDGSQIAQRTLRELTDAFAPQDGLTTLEALLGAINPSLFAFFELKVAGIEKRVLKAAEAVFGDHLRLGSFSREHLAAIPAERCWLIGRASGDPSPTALPDLTGGASAELSITGLAARANACPLAPAVPERAVWAVRPQMVPGLLAAGVCYFITDDPIGVREVLVRLAGARSSLRT